MPINRHRQKLLNALIYFAENVNLGGRTKYYKLLNYLDFLHYQRIGRSVTGLDYYAFERGPVPLELKEELENKPQSDFIDHLIKSDKKYGNGWVAHQLIPRKQFDKSLFSTFELELMEMLAKKHFKDTAEQMSEDSHFETGPWHEVWEVRKQKNAIIPYNLVLERRNNALDQAVMEIASDRAKHFQNH